jgi:hypothetical protein
VVGAHTAAADATARSGRWNHLCPKGIAGHSATTGATHKSSEIRHCRGRTSTPRRRGPPVDVVDHVRQLRIRSDDKDRTEHLFVGDPHVLADITHDGRCDLASGPVRQGLRSGSNGFDGGTVDPGVVDQPDDAVEVGHVHRGAVVGIGDDRREHAVQRLSRDVDERVDAVIGNEHVVRADTHLPPVDHSSLCNAGGRSLDVGIRRHHHRILAAQLERHRNEVLRGGLLHQRADRRRTREKQLVERQARGHRGYVATTRDDVEFRRVEVLARRRDCPVHVLCLGGRGAAQHQACGRADVVELCAGGGPDQLAVDEHSGFGAPGYPVAQVDAGLGPRLRRRSPAPRTIGHCGRSTVTITVGCYNSRHGCERGLS